MWAGTWASYLPFFMAGSVNGVVAFKLAHTNSAVGKVVFAQGLAMAALATLGGAGADRWPKRLVLTITQLAAAAVFGSFTLLLALDRLTIQGMAAGSFVIGVAVSFLGPARQALSAELVEPALRGNAVTLNQVPLTGSQVLGPALAAVLLPTALGAIGAYGLMSGSYAVAVLSLVALPRSRARADAGETHMLADLLDGLRYVASHRRLRLLVLYFMSVIMAGLSYNTVLPGLVEHALGRAAEDTPQLFLTGALGGLVVTFGIARVADSRYALPLFVVMPFLLAAGLFALSLSPSYEAAIASMLLVGIGFSGFQGLNAAVIVRETEPAYFGRVFSLSLFAFACLSLMSLPVGLLADSVGERTTLLVLAGIVTALACGASLVLLRSRD
jgi:MFS family permease